MDGARRSSVGSVGAVAANVPRQYYVAVGSTDVKLVGLPHDTKAERLSLLQLEMPFRVASCGSFSLCNKLLAMPMTRKFNCGS